MDTLVEIEKTFAEMLPALEMSPANPLFSVLMITVRYNVEWRNLKY